MSGRAVVNCAVTDQGHLQDCRSHDETPTGLGFGKAALALTRLFVLRPQTVNGVAVSDGRVNVPIAFRPAPGPPAFEPKAPASPAALALGQKLTAVNGSAAGSLANFEVLVRQVETRPRADVDDETRAEIAAGLRASYPVAAAEAQTKLAKVYANAFSAAELTKLAAFFSSPVGTKTSTQDEGIRLMAGRIGAENARLATLASREAFCVSRDCQASAEPPDRAALVARMGEVALPDPVLIQQATLNQIEMARPGLARTFGLGGVVALKCQTTRLGVLTACAVASEAPAGLGLGAAALTLAPSYRLDATLPEQSALGRSVALVIRFEPPGPPPGSFVQVTPRSPQALALARQALDAQTDAYAVLVAWRRRMDTQPNPPVGLTPTERAYAYDALAVGSAKAGQTALGLRAAYMTTRLSDAELTEAVRFWRSPVGRAWSDKAGEITDALQQISADFYRALWTGAGEALCKTRACIPAVAPAPPQPIPATSAPSTLKPCARPLSASNRWSSVPVRKAWRPRASISSKRAPRRRASRWAATSSRSRMGVGEVSARARRAAWARVKFRIRAFCSPVEHSAAGRSFSAWMTARSPRCGPVSARPAAASRGRAAASAAASFASMSAISAPAAAICSHSPVRPRSA